MKKIVLFGSSLLLALTLGGCANSTSKNTHKDTSSKIEKKVASQQSAYFKNNDIKTRDISLTINQKNLIKFNNQEYLRLLFTIKNKTNNAINNLMNNNIIKASQKIDNKEVSLPVVDESVNDSTIEKTNKNDHVEAQSTTQSVMYFKVKNINQPIILTAYNKHGKKIGTETLQPNTVKTININTNTNNQNNNNSAQNNSVKSDSQNNSAQSQNNNFNSQQQTTQQQSKNTQQNQQQPANTQQNQQQVKNNQQNTQPQTLQAFVAKYGVSPALYKMQHDGMSELQALEATPNNMKTSGELQLQHQLEQGNQQ